MLYEGDVASRTESKKLNKFFNLKSVVSKLYQTDAASPHVF